MWPKKRNGLVFEGTSPDFRESKHYAWCSFDLIPSARKGLNDQIESRKIWMEKKTGLALYGADQQG